MLHKLVLGTVQLGMPYGINNTSGQPSNEEAFALLREAWTLGIRTLDTADAYGTAIERIGDFHAHHNATSSERFRIITKFHADSGTELLTKTPQTLTKLHVPSLTCYQYHRFSDVSAFPHIQNQLQTLKEQGVIERIGVSVYTNDEIAAAASSPLIDVIQFPFNLLDNMRLRGDAMRHAKDCGKELHTRSVFLQGLFFKSLEDFPAKLAPLQSAIQRLHRLCKSSNFALRTMQELALNYALHNPLIDAVLFGVETASQLTETLGAVRDNFDPALAREIDALTVPDYQLLNPVHWSS
ncbi:MAG: aldo/keto reductase [Candidatus Kapabacteria bacterium]|nr:aldo/keto reductase [Candidatus Kapabacteria bacterium]